MAAQIYYKDHPASSSVSRVSSPYDTPTDERHPHNYGFPSGSAATSTQHLTGYPDTSYSSAYGSNKPLPNPYADNIPLSENPQRIAGTAPVNPHGFMQPEILPTQAPLHRSKRKNGPKFLYRKGVLIPWFVYVLTTVQIGVFIYELIKNAALTKSPIEIHPSFNIMIGPSPWVLINLGARFVPCMRQLNTTITNADGSSYMQDVRNLQFSCPNTTSLDITAPQCQLSELCGMGGIPDINSGGQPNQWWRFIVPIFLHAGILHIGFNMLLQMTLGAEVERQIGTIRFFILYFCSGIFGFLLGGNYAPHGIASTGASGALFGVLAFTLIDLLYTWKERAHPVKDLIYILVDVVISFVLGLLPGLDNFSHIGGFLIGIAVSLVVIHSPQAFRKQLGDRDPPYTPVDTSAPTTGMQKFARQPVGFFKGRKPLWWAWWLIRAGVLAALVVVTILLFRNFYLYHQECKWCKYLSCLPVSNWCDLGGLTSQNVTVPSNSGQTGARFRFV